MGEELVEMSAVIGAMDRNPKGSEFCLEKIVGKKVLLAKHALELHRADYSGSHVVLEFSVYERNGAVLTLLEPGQCLKYELSKVPRSNQEAAAYLAKAYFSVSSRLAKKRRASVQAQ